MCGYVCVCVYDVVRVLRVVANGFFSARQYRRVTRTIFLYAKYKHERRRISTAGNSELSNVYIYPSGSSFFDKFGFVQRSRTLTTFSRSRFVEVCRNRSKYARITEWNSFRRRRYLHKTTTWNISKFDQFLFF